jgi:hypothetical protein
MCVYYLPAVCTSYLPWFSTSVEMEYSFSSCILCHFFIHHSLLYWFIDGTDLLLEKLIHNKDRELHYMEV